MTITLLSLHKAGFFDLDAVILAVAILAGGLAQVVAGIMEFRNDNTFGTTVFVSYGLFWLALAVAMLAGDVDKAVLGWYLLLLAGFTAMMFIASFNISLAFELLFGGMTLLFVALGTSEFVNGDAMALIAGWYGLFIGATAVYVALAEILNETFERTVLPIGWVDPMDAFNRIVPRPELPIG